MIESADRFAPLSASDLNNLSAWQWAYRLTAGDYGARFTRNEAAHLAFVGLLVEHQCYADDRAPAGGGIDRWLTPRHVARTASAAPSTMSPWMWSPA